MWFSVNAQNTWQAHYAEKNRPWIDVGRDGKDEIALFKKKWVQMLIKNALYNGFRLAVYVQQMQVVDSMLGESMYLILIFFLIYIVLECGWGYKKPYCK